jgi:ectoine hydroxylase-related dioxygenase (phytanoyl-CoA dioxygenase family)
MTISDGVRTGITPEETARLEADGFLRVGPVLTADELAEARVNVDRIVAEQVRLGKRPEYAMAVHALDAYFMRLACHPRLLDILECVMGPDIVLVSTHLLCKPPRDGHPVSWHQDGAFAAIEPMSLVTLYLALDDCSADNGCMCMLPGSHKGGLARHDVIRDGATTRKELGRDVIDAYPSVPLELHAGECSLHLPWTIHGSAANRSDRRRAALPMRYISGASRILPVNDDNLNPERQPVEATAQLRWLRGQELSESLRAVTVDGRPVSA